MISELLAAAGGLSVAAVPAGLALHRMWGRLDRARIECTKARYDATHDRLTGLRNRAGLEIALAERVESGRPWALLMVDLDGFKPVNDQFGHDAGDEVLIEASFQLAETFSEPGDVVGRLGGDEFLVLIDVNESGHMSPWARAVEACRAVRAPMVLASGQPVTVTASIGVALALPGSDLARVQRSADVALYRAKCYGGDQPVQYDVSGKLAVVAPGRPGVRLREMAGIQRDLSEASR